MPIKLSADVQPSGGIEGLAAAILAKVREPLNEAADALGEAASDAVVAEAGATYGSTGGERSTTLHAASNYVHETRETASGVNVRFGVDGSDDFLAKFHSLDKGGGRTSGHQITARNAPNLVFQSPGYRTPFVGRTVYWKSSGGKFGTGFFRRGIEQAITNFSGL